MQPRDTARMGQCAHLLFAIRQCRGGDMAMVYSIDQGLDSTSVPPIKSIHLMVIKGHTVLFVSSSTETAIKSINAAAVLSQQRPCCAGHLHAHIACFVRAHVHNRGSVDFC